MEHGLLLLDIEPMGAKQVKQSAPDAVLIFIMPPSREELERRLRSRGDTSEEQIKMRLERASWKWSSEAGTITPSLTTTRSAAPKKS